MINGLAQRIKIARRAFGISQEDLAEVMNVSRQTIYQWEAGEYAPSTERVVLLTKILRVSPVYLLNGEGPPPEVRKSENGRSIMTRLTRIIESGGLDETLHKLGWVKSNVKKRS